MDRRKFLGLSVSGLLTKTWLDWTNDEELIIGHGDYRYTVDVNWGALNPHFFPVKDCHEMVIDQSGRIILLTNHTRNNLLIYDRSGKLLEAWGKDYPGAHGLSLQEQGGTDFLYLTDTVRHEVIKTDLKGRVIMRLPAPVETKYYDKPEEYLPTETAIARNGDIFVADGYGKQYILHYNAMGQLLNIFGGKGTAPHQFSNAHGIAVDNRHGGEEKLLITARQQNALKVFDRQGNYQETISLPGAYICRPVIHQKQIYLATIWSGEGKANSGFISILDEHNHLVSAPGGSAPRYFDGQLQKMHQALQVFKHPHDVCIDSDENIYVAQWNSGATYPIKLTRV